MTTSQGSGIGSLPKLQGHVVAQLHASMTSPRIRHTVSVAMMRLRYQFSRGPARRSKNLTDISRISRVRDGDRLAFVRLAQRGSCRGRGQSEPWLVRLAALKLVALLQNQPSGSIFRNRLHSGLCSLAAVSPSASSAATSE